MEVGREPPFMYNKTIEAIRAEKAADRMAIGLPSLPDKTGGDYDKVVELQHQLAECYRLSGADPDGNEDWRLAPRAAEEVKRMRDELDAAQTEIWLHEQQDR